VRTGAGVRAVGTQFFSLRPLSMTSFTT
jgi:hypothetical protein